MQKRRMRKHPSFFIWRRLFLFLFSNFGRLFLFLFLGFAFMYLIYNVIIHKEYFCFKCGIFAQKVVLLQWIKSCQYVFEAEHRPKPSGVEE